jgi:hypothetical protein
MSNFETWWEREGQEFLYALNTTTDDDIKLVAEIAWKNGAYCAEQAEKEHDGHWSDCSVHNEPAYPNGPCDCGGYQPKHWRCACGANLYIDSNGAPASKADCEVWSYNDMAYRPGGLSMDQEQESNSIFMEGYRIGLAEMREKCAKVCDDIERKRWETMANGGTLVGWTPKDCAAAIRSMK